MAENYGPGYCVLALLGGQGYYCTYRADSACFVGNSLSLPVSASLEKCCLETGIPYFYYPAFLLSEKPVNIRCAPSGFQNQSFRAFNLPGRMDGFIFTRTIREAVMPEGQQSVRARQELFDKRLVRMMKRRQEM